MNSDFFFVEMSVFFWQHVRVTEICSIFLEQFEHLFFYQDDRLIFRRELSQQAWIRLLSIIDESCDLFCDPVFFVSMVKECLWRSMKVSLSYSIVASHSGNLAKFPWNDIPSLQNTCTNRRCSKVILLWLISIESITTTARLTVNVAHLLLRNTVYIST